MSRGGDPGGEQLPEGTHSGGAIPGGSGGRWEPALLGRHVQDCSVFVQEWFECMVQFEVIDDVFTAGSRKSIGECLIL